MHQSWILAAVLCTVAVSGQHGDRPASPTVSLTDSQVRVRILAINDFHGHLSAGQRIENRPVGGAAVLAAYLLARQAAPPDRLTFIVHAGDHVGASPLESSLFQDEPSIAFFNLLGNQSCTYADPRNPHCNLVGTPGNHEFDEGQEELLRLIKGGNHHSGPFLEHPYRGARFPYVSANVVDKVTGDPLLPPFVIKEADGIRLAFIGAVLKTTPTIVRPSGVTGLTFLDEASSINRYVRRLRETEGIRTFVVLLHQGGSEPPYDGPTRRHEAVLGEAIEHIAHRLDDDVDVIVSGHAHSFTNTRFQHHTGAEILITQAFSSGTAFGDIDLLIDRRTGDVREKTASIVTTYADAGPGLMPDQAVARLVSELETKVRPLADRVIGTAAAPLLRQENAAGESALGHLIADAHRAAMDTDFAFMNPGGIRGDLPAGPLRYRDLFSMHPFGNRLVRMTLTGDEIYELLNQQWENQAEPRMLKVSGLTYTWDHDRQAGDRVTVIRANGAPIDRAARYSVTVNDYLAAGGDHFLVLRQGRDQQGGPRDLEALIAYIQSRPHPLVTVADERITRLN